VVSVLGSIKEVHQRRIRLVLGDRFRVRAGKPSRYVGLTIPAANLANSTFHSSGVGKWRPTSAAKAKAGMVHSVRGWTRGCADNTVRSVDNACLTCWRINWHTVRCTSPASMCLTEGCWNWDGDQSLSLYAWPSTGGSALHADRSIATLQASGGESPVLVVTCSTQHFRGRPGCFLQVPNCPGPCRDVTESCRTWWTRAAWSIRLTWPKRECLLRLIAFFMDGSCERMATSSFVTSSYQKMPSIRLWKASSFAISIGKDCNFYYGLLSSASIRLLCCPLRSIVQERTASIGRLSSNIML